MVFVPAPVGVYTAAGNAAEAVVFEVGFVVSAEIADHQVFFAFPSVAAAEDFAVRVLFVVDIGWFQDFYKYLFFDPWFSYLSHLRPLTELV